MQEVDLERLHKMWADLLVKEFSHLFKLETIYLNWEARRWKLHFNL